MRPVYSKPAAKFLNKQDQQTQDRIKKSISKLPDGDVKKLSGRDGYRLRIGDFRILFDIDDSVIKVKVIDNRGQIYK